MTRKQFFMKLDQLSSKPMTIERMTDFANTIILAYREDLYMYCLKGEKAHYCDLNIETTTGNIIRLDNAINSIQKTIDDLKAKVETKKGELEQMKIDIEKPFEKEQELAAAEAELEEVHVKLTQFELTDDSAQRDMFERFVDDFTEVLTGEKFYVKYESNCEAFMPLHVEMNSDILTIAQTTVQNGDLL